MIGNPALGFRTTRLRGQGGHYYGRFPITGPVPAGTDHRGREQQRPAGHQKTARSSTWCRSKARYDADAGTLS